MLLSYKKTKESFKDGFCPIIAFDANDLQAKDGMSVRLSIGLVGITKTCQKVNIFLEAVGSMKKMNLEPLKPVLNFLLDGTSLGEKQERGFFELQKHISHIDREMNKITESAFWDYGTTEKISAAILGLPLELLSDLEYSEQGDNDKMMRNFEEAMSAYQGYVFADTPYEEFVPKVKKELEEFNKKYSDRE